MNDNRSLQEIHDPSGICFGCGPSNPDGLHLQSYLDGDVVVAEWTPAHHHQAFPGILNGGIIGTLLDCHMNWAAAMAMAAFNGAFARTVTANYRIELTRPTPTDRPLQLRAWATEASERKASTEATLSADGETSATAIGLFVIPRSAMS